MRNSIGCKEQLFPVLLERTTLSLQAAEARVQQSTVLFLDLTKFFTFPVAEQRE